ncbi:hypothetical protein PENTCL1PPCAC_18573, partial [Pristionchus entomophagus]
ASGSLYRQSIMFRRAITAVRPLAAAASVTVAVPRAALSTTVLSSTTVLRVSAPAAAQQMMRFSAKAPLTKKTLEDRILLVLGCYDKIDEKKLSMDADFVKDLGLDSLDHVEVVMAMEEEFGFEIPDGDADQFKTPRHIWQYICDKEDVYE